jgi:hypothetical protein
MLNAVRALRAAGAKKISQKTEAAHSFIGAIARRATSIASTATASNAQHSAACALTRMHRKRLGSWQNSKHKPRTGRRATARVRTSCGQRTSRARDTLTAVHGALGRRSPVDLPCWPRPLATAACGVPVGKGGDAKLRSGVDHGMVEAPETAHNDNAPRGPSRSAAASPCQPHIITRISRSTPWKRSRSSPCALHSSRNGARRITTAPPCKDTARAANPETSAKGHS